MPFTWRGGDEGQIRGDEERTGGVEEEIVNTDASCKEFTVNEEWRNGAVVGREYRVKGDFLKRY